MKYPSILEPFSVESFTLSTGVSIPVPKASPAFPEWTGEKFESTYGGKPVIDLLGEPLFAELAILRIFQNEGWAGVWVDSYGNRFRTIWGGRGVELPAEKQLLLDEIKSASTSASGCWDVFCWKGDNVLFAEAKRLRNDRIRSSQVCWLEAAFKCGLNERSFLLVEWSFA